MTEPLVSTPPTGAPAQPDDDAARHVLARPLPLPPDPAPTPGVAAAPDPATAVADSPAPDLASSVVLPRAVDTTDVVPASPVTSTGPDVIGAPPSPGTGPAVGAAVPAPPATDGAYEFPDPAPPRPAGVGTHVLGALVGLVAGPVAALAALLGQSRILVVQTDHWDGSVEWLGIALVVVGVLLAAALVLLATWTAAAPITGGAVLTLLGAIALAVPRFSHDQVLALVDSEGWHTTIVQTVVAATSGTLLALGVLLLVAGLTAAATRRRGVHLGHYRERNRTAG